MYIHTYIYSIIPPSYPCFSLIPGVEDHLLSLVFPGTCLGRGEPENDGKIVVKTRENDGKMG